jgi:hypothetical protein
MDVNGNNEKIKNYLQSTGRAPTRDQIAKLSLCFAKSALNTICDSAFMADSYVSCELDNGQSVFCITTDSNDIDAEADVFEQSYIVRVSAGRVRMLFSIVASIWQSPVFRNHLASTLRNVSSIQDLPPGFEEYCVLTSSVPIENSSIPFVQSFIKSVQFVWLHECAHVFFGHVHATQLGIAGAVGNAPKEWLDIPFHAMEIQADELALRILWSSVHRKVLAHMRSVRQKNLREKRETVMLPDLELVSTIVGVAAFSLSENGVLAIRNARDTAERHPPLWFRTNMLTEVFIEELPSAWQETFGNGKESAFNATLNRYVAIVQSVVSGITAMHPTFGEWSMMHGDDILSAARKFKSDATKNFEQWLDITQSGKCWPKSQPVVL